MSAEARAVLGERLMFCLPPGEEMLGYPVPGTEEATLPGRRRYNVVWYRPADEETRLPRLLTGRDGRRHDLSIPPGQVAIDAVAELYADADALLAPYCAEVVRLSREPFIQAIYDLESPRLVFGRTILVGDAAFVARPHGGMGVTKAACDALTLARQLVEAVPPHEPARSDRSGYGACGMGAQAAALWSCLGRACALARRACVRTGHGTAGITHVGRRAGDGDRHSPGERRFLRGPSPYRT
jgi:2-polyprenyl-6-methoxyphenol hydroxylase-like FAD-dependent oxidoreductase